MITLFKKKKKAPVAKDKTPLMIKITDDMFAAVSLIVNEDTWCQRALAMNASGERLFDPSDESAVAWDILGALHKVDAGKETFTYLRIAAKFAGFNDLDRFNDFNPHWMVMLFFKAAFAEMGCVFKRVDTNGVEIT